MTRASFTQDQKENMLAYLADLNTMWSEPHFALIIGEHRPIAWLILNRTGEVVFMGDHNEIIAHMQGIRKGIAMGIAMMV